MSGIYETGKTLIDAGVIPGSDITPEAALTKLSYVLSKDNWDLNQKRRAMDYSMRGEMTIQFEAVNCKRFSASRVRLSLNDCGLLIDHLPE